MIAMHCEYYAVKKKYLQLNDQLMLNDGDFLLISIGRVACLV